MPSAPESSHASSPSVPQKIAEAYGYLRLLSLDVVAGAVAGGMLAARFVRAEMGWAFYVVLALSVWSIYTLDHLLDARRLGEAASTKRHQFHHRYFKPIAALWAILSFLAVVLALAYLGSNGIYFGIGMGGITLLHLWLVKLVGNKTSPFLIKEFGVAFVYSAGIWGLPVIEAGAWDESPVLLAFGIFLLLATVNLLEFSLYEVEIDEKDGHSSFVRALGPKRGRLLVGALLALLLAAIGVAAIYALFQIDNMEVNGIPAEQEEWLLPIYFLMWLVLMLLLVFPKYFSRAERYRVWGDGAFLLPFLSLWL